MQIGSFAVSVFGHDAFGLGLILPFLFVVGLPIQEQDDIGVLLDGAGLTQVGQHGAVVAAAIRPREASAGLQAMLFMV